MSLVTEPNEFHPDVLDRPCFLCGAAIVLPAVHWMGCGSVSAPMTLALQRGDHTHILKDWPIGEALNIYFHPPCAVSFCRRLLQDSEQLV